MNIVKKIGIAMAAGLMLAKTFTPAFSQPSDIFHNVPRDSGDSKQVESELYPTSGFYEFFQKYHTLLDKLNFYFEQQQILDRNENKGKSIIGAEYRDTFKLPFVVKNDETDSKRSYDLHLVWSVGIENRSSGDGQDATPFMRVGIQSESNSDTEDIISKLSYRFFKEPETNELEGEILLSGMKLKSDEVGYRNWIGLFLRTTCKLRDLPIPFLKGITSPEKSEIEIGVNIGHRYDTASQHLYNSNTIGVSVNKERGDELPRVFGESKFNAGKFRLGFGVNVNPYSFELEGLDVVFAYNIGPVDY
jgi:hypothetical protein